jgi:hypothetical protein
MSRRITRKTLRKIILQEMRQIIREDDGGGINPATGLLPEVQQFIQDAYPQFAGALFTMAKYNSQVGPGLNKLYRQGEAALREYLETMQDAWKVANKLKNKTQDLGLQVVDPLNLRRFFSD